MRVKPRSRTCELLQDIVIPRGGGAPRNAEQTPQAPSARPHALARERLAELEIGRGNHSPLFLDYKSTILNATGMRAYGVDRRPDRLAAASFSAIREGINPL